ncbi:MAG: hypothetical protein LCH52_15360 [Bacteroidetes bacterium]|nr:hypothetical protein [Bacteroidota bacterium]
MMFKEKAAKLLKLNSELISRSPVTEFLIEELESMGIHPAFIKFLWAESILEGEKEGSLKASISKEELLVILKKAAVFNLNFLFNPVFLLKKHIFSSKDGVNPGLLADLRNRVYYFRYYIDILEKLQKSGKLLESDYDETMQRVNKKLLDGNFNSIISDGVDALSHFFNYKDEFPSLDRECMKLFLLSRGLNDAYEKLLPHYERKELLSVWKIKDVLTGDETSIFDAHLEVTREIKPQRPVLAPLPQEETPTVADQGITEPVPVIEKKKEDLPPIDFKREEQVRKAPETMSSKTIEETISAPKKKIEFEEVVEPGVIKPSDDAMEIISKLPSINDEPQVKIIDDEPVQRYEFSFPPRVDPEISTVKEKKNILSLLDQDESLKIIQHIFDGDHSDFFSSIEALEKCAGISEARNLLSIIFANAGLSEKNKYARLLTEKTERSFTG